MITSTIIGNEDLNKAPKEENLIVGVCDESGDSEFEYTTCAWKINDEYGVSDNVVLYPRYIKMWAYFPVE